MVSNGGVVVLGDAADPGGQGTHRHAGAVHIRYIHYKVPHTFQEFFYIFCLRGRFPSLPLFFTLLHMDPGDVRQET